MHSNSRIHFSRDAFKLDAFTFFVKPVVPVPFVLRRKTLAANPAFIRFAFFVVFLLHMLPQLGLIMKPHVALRAPMRLVFVMTLPVLRQLGISRKLVTTKIAFVGTVCHAQKLKKLC